MILNSAQIFNKLKQIDWNNVVGTIEFNLANIKVKVNNADIVGIILQYWLKEYFKTNNIFFEESLNTQEFPDFFLSENHNENLLEVKAFRYSNAPAFDIANFESYCDLVQNNPQKLFADYIIFGYEMNLEGLIVIKDIWLKKIWEIAGISSKYPLKVQTKRDKIYNIRPNSAFKKYKQVPFNSYNEFIEAIYQTLKIYKTDQHYADKWLKNFNKNFKKNIQNKLFKNTTNFN